MILDNNICEGRSLSVGLLLLCFVFLLYFILLLFLNFKCSDTCASLPQSYAFVFQPIKNRKLHVYWPRVSSSSALELPSASAAHDLARGLISPIFTTAASLVHTDLFTSSAVASDLRYRLPRFPAEAARLILEIKMLN